MILILHSQKICEDQNLVEQRGIEIERKTRYQPGDLKVKGEEKANKGGYVGHL